MVGVLEGTLIKTRVPSSGRPICVAVIAKLAQGAGSGVTVRVEEWCVCMLT
jgi:hypothetical protein